MDMDTAWPTTVTMAMPTLMPTDTTTARGPLRLRPLLMLTTVIIMDTGWPTTDTDMPTMDTTDTPMLTTVTTTARGPLMLSPLLMLTTVIIMDMLHTDMLTVDTTATPMLTMATTATDTITNLLLFC